MFHWHKDKNEAWGQNKIGKSKQIKFTSYMNFKNTCKMVMIISEVVNGSGFILRCLAWDIMKTFLSLEVYFY